MVEFSDDNVKLVRLKYSDYQMFKPNLTTYTSC